MVYTAMPRVANGKVCGRRCGSLSAQIREIPPSERLQVWYVTKPYIPRGVANDGFAHVGRGRLEVVEVFHVVHHTRVVEIFNLGFVTVNTPIWCSR